MNLDVLNNTEAAQRAIPDMGYHWPDDKLLALGTEVRAVYPELEKWRPYLAAEAYLFYAARSARDPVVEPRTEDFLIFLRATVASTVYAKRS